MIHFFVCPGRRWKLTATSPVRPLGTARPSLRRTSWNHPHLFHESSASIHGIIGNDSSYRRQIYGLYLGYATISMQSGWQSSFLKGWPSHLPLQAASKDGGAVRAFAVRRNDERRRRIGNPYTLSLWMGHPKERGHLPSGAKRDRRKGRRTWAVLASRRER